MADQFSNEHCLLPLMVCTVICTMVVHTICVPTLSARETISRLCFVLGPLRIFSASTRAESTSRRCSLYFLSEMTLFLKKGEGERGGEKNTKVSSVFMEKLPKPPNSNFPSPSFDSSTFFSVLRLGTETEYTVYTGFAETSWFQTDFVTLCHF